MMGEPRTTSTYCVEDGTANFALPSVSTPSPAMTYDDVFPGLPETVIAAQTDRTIGRWNNKLRVGSRSVTQVFFCKACVLHSRLTPFFQHPRYFTSLMRNADLNHPTSSEKEIF